MPLSAFPYFTVKGNLNNATTVILHLALDTTHSELCFVFLIPNAANWIILRHSLRVLIQLSNSYKLKGQNG